MIQPQLDCWRQRLAGSLPMFDLLVDRRRPGIHTDRGALRSFQIEARLVEAIHTLGQQTGTLWFMLLPLSYTRGVANSAGSRSAPLRCKPGTERPRLRVARSRRTSGRCGFLDGKRGLGRVATAGQRFGFVGLTSGATSGHPGRSRGRRSPASPSSPTPKGAHKRLGCEPSQHIAEAVERWKAIGQPQVLAHPLRLGLAPRGHVPLSAPQTPHHSSVRLFDRRAVGR